MALYVNIVGQYVKSVQVKIEQLKNRYPLEIHERVRDCIEEHYKHHRIMTAEDLTEIIGKVVDSWYAEQMRGREDSIVIIEP